MDELEKLKIAEKYFKSIEPVTEINGPYAPSKSEKYYNFAIRMHPEGVFVFERKRIEFGIGQVFRETGTIFIDDLPDTEEEIIKVIESHIDNKAIRLLNIMKKTAEYYTPRLQNENKKENQNEIQK